LGLGASVEYIYCSNMWHSKRQVKAFYWKKITAIFLSDFKVFTVHLQTMVCVKLLTRSKPLYLTCILLDTGHFLLRWTLVWHSRTLVDTHIAVVIFHLIRQIGIELELSINIRLHFVMPTSGLHYEWHLLFGPNSSILPKLLHCNNCKPGTQDAIFHTPVTLFSIALCYVINIWSNYYSKFAVKCKECTSQPYKSVHNSGDFSTQKNISFLQTKHS
jgi:hypothetical protein